VSVKHRRKCMQTHQTWLMRIGHKATKSVQCPPTCNQHNIHYIKLPITSTFSEF